jgi:hypothetical protein
MSNINFTEQELIQILRQHLTGPSKDLLAEAILGTADSDWRKEKIFKAAMGIRPVSELTLHEEYLVTASSVSTYLMDEAKSIEQGYVNSNDQLTCKLISYNPWESSQYKIEYKYINDTGKEKTTTYDVPASYLTLAEEFPEDF